MGRRKIISTKVLWKVLLTLLSLCALVDARVVSDENRSVNGESDKKYSSKCGYEVEY